MSDYRLTSKAEAVSLFAAHFSKGTAEPSIVSIREDKCFRASEWMNLGTILLQPGEKDKGEELLDRLGDAVSLGFFEWKCPSFRDASDELWALMDVKTDAHKSRADRALDSVGCVAARVGLIHPSFDADAIAQMPFRRPTTVVTDTSGVLQGGLDFVVRFLYPMARLKVPAISHMEILNAADNYFKYRYATKLSNKAKALFEHAISQGGQRALLRLELQTEAEIERGRLGADPLRGVVQSDSDAEDSSLGLQKIQRSFADRLIFETARQHLAQTNPDHPITLLTADQGLARMTLGEGMQTLFFEKTGFDSISGRTFSGTTFDPFTGKIYTVSLMDLLWELAVTFGMARLATLDGKSSIEIGAMGDELTWQPYHAKDDLLWIKRTSEVVQPGNSGPNAPTAVDAIPKKASFKAPRDKREKTRAAAVPSEKAKKFTGSYKFGVSKLFALIDQVVSDGPLTREAAMHVVSVNSPAALEEYISFLVSGSLIEREEAITRKPELVNLLQSLKTRDLNSATSLFGRVPSFGTFLGFLENGAAENPVAQRARPTYAVLGEVLGVCFTIPDEGLFATLAHPTAEVFAEIALAAYDRLSGTSDQYILTGHWLEEIVRSTHVHPITSRFLLEAAREKGLLERFTEGSTPETGYQNHALNLLEVIQGHPSVRRIGIFEGDFLLSGKSSVSIRLRRVQK